ncbi:MAG: M20/M25/M40 family metallo-hydrolase [Bacteroidota bacterium]
MNKLYKLMTLAVLCLFAAFSLYGQDKPDTTAMNKIKDEGMNHSQVMDIISHLCDVYGPRLTGSPEFNAAAKWAKDKLTSIGLENVYLDGWDPIGKGWSLKRYNATVICKQDFPLISYPKAWSPGTNGTVTGEVIWFNANTDSEVNLFKGKLKGKFVLLDTLRAVKAHFDAEGKRDADSTLLKMANAGLPDQRGGRGGRGGRFQMSPEMKQRALVNYHKLMMCQDEKAAALLNVSQGDGGTMFVQQASVPTHPDTSFANRVAVYSVKAPEVLPQIVVGVEHYNRLVRMIMDGETPKIEMKLEVKFTKPDSCHNIIGEIPGTDLKDEIVMIGGHFDSWHAGTGATDDGTGAVACIEAMRILKATGLAPRRTIRIGLWAGEEEGLLGSAAYVKHHLGERGETTPGQTAPPEIKLMPAAEKFDVYFNDDNGSGKFRGVYLQGNESARPIFREWLAPFRDMGASTITLSNTGGTDHLSFDAIGLPAFQFIQDELEYGTRTHHSNMDVVDRVQEDDMKQASVIMAAFAYDAAMRDAKIPHKPAPKPSSPAGSQ